MVADRHPALRQFYEEPDAASIALTPMSRLVVHAARGNQPKNPQGLTILAVLPPLRDMPFPRSVIASGALPSSPAKGWPRCLRGLHQTGPRIFLGRNKP
jgi:hypothetical protein